MGLNTFDFAYLCKFSFSSISDRWSGLVVGNIEDSDSIQSPFGVHTERELNPFVRIDFPFEVKSLRVVLEFREKYEKKDLPIT